MAAPYIYADNGNEYITGDDLTAAMDPQVINALGDDDENGAIDLLVLNRAITAARSVVEAYACNKFAIPLINVNGAVPEIVREWNINIALYKLFGHRMGVPDYITAAYLNTMDELKAMGPPNLVGPPDLEQSEQPITTNMTVDDLGMATENGVALPWSRIL